MILSTVIKQRNNNNDDDDNKKISGQIAVIAENVLSMLYQTRKILLRIIPKFKMQRAGISERSFSTIIIAARFMSAKKTHTF